MLTWKDRTAAVAAFAASLVAGVVAGGVPAFAEGSPELASVTVIQDTKPDVGRNLKFVLSGGGIKDVRVVLDDDADARFSNLTTVRIPGNDDSARSPYLLTQKVPPGFALADILCTYNGNPIALDSIKVLDRSGRLVGVTGRVRAGDAVTCTFVTTLISARQVPPGLRSSTAGR